jgi:hypothetical protein
MKLPRYIIRDRDGAYASAEIALITSSSSTSGIFAICTYKQYHNEFRTHLSLNKDAPIQRDAQGRACAPLADLGRTSPSVRPNLNIRQGQP